MNTTGPEEVCLWDKLYGVAGNLSRCENVHYCPPRSVRDALSFYAPAELREEMLACQRSLAAANFQVLLPPPEKRTLTERSTGTTPTAGACKYRAVVFDFDKTILTVDVYNELRRRLFYATRRRGDLAGALAEAGVAADDVLARWFGGGARVAALRALLARLRRARPAVAVYICSFSYAPVIRELPVKILHEL